MGQGIAQSVAMGGYPVILYDIIHANLDRAMEAIGGNLQKGVELGKVTADQKKEALERITPVDQLVGVAADLIIEAVVEDLQVKRELFSKLESLNTQDTIFASNTSSIPITQIASALESPHRFAGLHFFNPAYLMKLVEVIKGNKTEAGVVPILMEFVRSIGKTPVQATDAPGFIVNRVARHYYLESLRILEEQVADHQVIDELLEGYGFRMGPFKLMDLIGIDINYAVTTSIFDAFHYDPKFRPSRIQQNLVAAGHLGKKSGKGFYDYQ